MAYITMVKKIKRNGQPCSKCRDIENRLRREEYINQIDRIVIAEHDDPESEGMRLSRLYNVRVTPFFVASNENGEISIYTVYNRFVREVLKPAKQVELRLLAFSNRKKESAAYIRRTADAYLGVKSGQTRKNGTNG